MPPKKNPFICFAMMRKKEMEAQGVEFPEGTKSAVEMFGPEWEKLSHTERLRFQNQAKAARAASAPKDNQNDGGTWQKIKTTHGMRLGAIMEEAMRRQHSEEIKRLNTINIFKRTEDQQLPLPEEQEFVIIEFTDYCVDACNNHIPAEVALTAFSLKAGILDNYSTLIDPASIPLGFAHDARTKRKELGNPNPPFGNDCQNYKNILRNIEKFLKHYPTERKPEPVTYLYCLRNEHEKVRSCLEWLANKCGVEREYCLYSLSLLLQQFGIYGKRRYLRDLELIEMLNRYTELKKLHSGLDDDSSSGITSDTDEASSSISSSVLSVGSSRYGEGVDPAISPCLPGFPIDDGRHRVRRIPHTSVHTMISKPIYKFRAGTISSSESLDKGNSSAQFWGTPSKAGDDPDDPVYCMAEKVPNGPGPDKELFMFETMAEEYLGSLDLAFCSELACPHHAVNGVGIITCALNVVNRYAYNIIDVIIGYFPAIFPVEGDHYPQCNPQKEAFKRRNMLHTWGRLGYKGLDGYSDSVVRATPLTENGKKRHAQDLKIKN